MWLYLTVHVPRASQSIHIEKVEVKPLLYGFLFFFHMKPYIITYFEMWVLYWSNKHLDCLNFKTVLKLQENIWNSLYDEHCVN